MTVPGEAPPPSVSDLMEEGDQLSRKGEAYWASISYKQAALTALKERDAILVALYRRDPVSIARLCDEELDRSGALLLQIRVRASVAT